MDVQSKANNDLEKIASSRSIIYRELSRLFIYPQGEWISSLSFACQNLSQAIEVISTGFPGLADNNPYSWDFSCNSLQNEELEAEFVRLFEFEAACYPYQSAYILHLSPLAIQSSIRDIYKDFGLVCSSYTQELPDHIVLELEFMHYLAYNHANSLRSTQEKTALFVDSQKQFLDNHLNQWIHPFCSCLSRTTKLNFYKCLAELTRCFISGDRAYLFSNKHF